MAHKVFVVDDHPVMRQGYAHLINSKIGLEICGEAKSAEEALEKIPEVDPDLVTVDLTMGGMGGLELIKQLQSIQPELPILVVSMHDEALYAGRALRAGARGYIMKSEAEGLVIKAIRRILDGGIFVSDKFKEQVLHQYIEADLEGRGSPLKQLSDRELEVFEYLGRGFTTRDIAEKLALSPKTISTYRTRLKEKLAVESNAELRRSAILWVERTRRGREGENS